MKVMELLEESLAVWHECPDSLPPFDRAITIEEQIDREAHLQAFLDSVQSEMHRAPVSRAERQSMHQRLTTALTTFGRAALRLEDGHVALLLEGGLSSIGTALARQARQFDSTVTVADIFQATRNAWTACGLQMLFSHRMHLSPSIFAYSMLYPYTDNYLDDSAIPVDTKRGFNARFGRRLAGDSIDPANQHEALIWKLVALIESQYPRAENPQVFESLLMIHRAQEQSVSLLRKGAAGPVDVLRLSFEKGGTSVLADGYLAAGRLSPEQARFVFYWGILLQLADDLQDVREDCGNGVLTLFTQAAGREPLDAVTSRTLHFGRRTMLLMHQLPAADCVPLQQLIQRSSLSIVIRSAGEAGEFYTPDYLKRLESHSPFRFSFLNERRAQFARRSGMLVRLFESFLAGDEDEPAFPLLPSSLMPRF
jgi:hypothetical protein